MINYVYPVHFSQAFNAWCVMQEGIYDAFHDSSPVFKCVTQTEALGLASMAFEDQVDLL